MSRLVFLVVFLFIDLGCVHAQWQIEESHTSADLRGIHALGNGIAWASGTEGTVLRTIDDGAHWQRCATPHDAEALDFRGIQAFDAKTAVVMSSGKGDLSRVYKTTDACITWELVFTNPDADGFFDAMSFAMTNKMIYGTGMWGKTVDLHDVERHVLGGRGYIVGDPVNGTFRVFQTWNEGWTW